MPKADRPFRISFGIEASGEITIYAKDEDEAKRLLTGSTLSQIQDVFGYVEFDVEDIVEVDEDDLAEEDDGVISGVDDE